MTQDIARFRVLLVNNFQNITDVITRVTEAILTVADVTMRLVRRAAQGFDDLAAWFDNLDSGSKRLIEGFATIIIAWRVLNTAFMRSPIGLITALAGAILLLYDDYETWNEGGKTLIDWAKWETDIKQAITALETIARGINIAAQAIGSWQHVLEGFAGFMATRWAVSVLASFGRATAAARTFLGLAGRGR